MLISTCISTIFSEANSCMQHFQFATAFIAVLLRQPCILQLVWQWIN